MHISPYIMYTFHYFGNLGIAVGSPDFSGHLEDLIVVFMLRLILAGLYS